MHLYLHVRVTLCYCLLRCHISQIPSYQTSRYRGHPFKYCTLHMHRSCQRSLFTPLKSMEEGRAEIVDSQILYTGLVFMTASHYGLNHEKWKRVRKSTSPRTQDTDLSGTRPHDHSDHAMLHSHLAFKRYKDLE